MGVGGGGFDPAKKKLTPPGSLKKFLVGSFFDPFSYYFFDKVIVTAYLVYLLFLLYNFIVYGIQFS